MEENPYYHKDDGNACLQVLAFLLCLGGCMGYQCYSSCDHKPDKAVEQVAKDTLTKEEKAKKAYEDSVKLAEWEKEHEEEQKKTAGGFIVEGDTLIHLFVHPGILLGAKISLISEYERYKTSRELCSECEEKEQIVSSYEDGELISVDDAYEQSYDRYRDEQIQIEKDRQEEYEERLREDQFW